MAALRLQKKSAAAASISRYGNSSSSWTHCCKNSGVSHEGSSSESSSSESCTSERSSSGSSDVESIDSERTKGQKKLENGESSTTSSCESSLWRKRSICGEGKVTEGILSNRWRYVQHPKPGTEYMPALASVAVMRGILQKFIERVETNLEQLQKQFLFRPPLPDSIRLELLGRVNHTVGVINNLAWTRHTYNTCETMSNRPQKTDKTFKQVTVTDASSVEEQPTGQSRINTGHPIPTQVLADPLATRHDPTPDIRNTVRHNGKVVPEKQYNSGRSKIHLPAADGKSRRRGTADSTRERHEWSKKRLQQPEAQNCVNSCRLSLAASEDVENVTDREEEESLESNRYTRDNQDDVKSCVEERLRPSDFIEGFRLMLQPAFDDPFERYVRIRKPDSALLRLLDYYQQHADLYETWDWEKDPLLVGSSAVAYPQTPGFDVKEMLRDAVALYEQLFILNIHNTRILTKLQDQLADAWTRADPAIKEADRLFVRSVAAVAEAMYTQKQIDDWNLTVLADKALGKREKYLVYDPSTGRLRLLRDSYLADIIPEVIDSEQLTRKLNKKIAALFLDADRRDRTHRRHFRKKSSLTSIEPEKALKGPAPSAAVPPGSFTPVGASDASLAFSDQPQSAKKSFPSVGATAHASGAVSRTPAVPSPKVWRSTAAGVAKQKIIPKFQLHTAAKQLEKSGKHLLQSPKLQQTERLAGSTLFPSKPDAAAVTGLARGSLTSSVGAAPTLNAAATTVEAVAASPVSVSSKKSLLPFSKAAAGKQEGQAFVDFSAQATLLRSPGPRKSTNNDVLAAGAPPAAHLKSTAKADTAATMNCLVARPNATALLSKPPVNLQHNLTSKPSPAALLKSKVSLIKQLKQEALVLPTVKQKPKLPVFPTHPVLSTKSVISQSLTTSDVPPHLTKVGTTAGGMATLTGMFSNTALPTSSTHKTTAVQSPSLTLKVPPVASLSPTAAKTAPPPFSKNTPTGGEPKDSGKPMQLRKCLPLPPLKTHTHSKIHPNVVLKKKL